MGVEAPGFENLHDRGRNAFANTRNFAQPPLGRDFSDAPRVKAQGLGSTRECTRAKWAFARYLQQAAMPLQDVGNDRVGDAGSHDASAAPASIRNFGDKRRTCR